MRNAPRSGRRTPTVISVTESEPTRRDREAAVEAATDELTDILVERVLPVVHRYRAVVAARLGLGLPELLCLDLLRLSSPLGGGAVAERVGLTPSTTSKMLRRLEADGHVVREPDPDHGQGLVVRLVPHEERDRVLDGFRGQVHSTVRAAVVGHALYREPDLPRAAGLLLQVVHGLQLAVGEETHRLWSQRAVSRRQRAREAAGRRPWWER